VTALRRLLDPVAALAGREIVRFLRERHRVFGALAQPLLTWALLAAGLRGSFRLPSAPAGATYGAYFFPGTVALIVFFTAIFSTISLIEDRREGFLQGVIAAPIPRASIAAGKVIGGAILATSQALLVLPLAPIAGLPLSFAGAAEALPAIACMAVSLTALSFCVAWRLESTQGFHAVMTVLLMPIWLLSGALFPAIGAVPWLRAAMAINPLTYGVALLRHALDPASAAGAGLPGIALSWIVMIVFGLAACVTAAVFVRSPGRTA
jgi:ABC-2 type transport system permease protein